jgi:hypothetical protein
MGASDKAARPAASPASGPDGIPAAARRYTGSSRQALAACAVGALILGLLSPPDLRSSTERFGDGPIAERIRDAASGWDDIVGSVDLTLPHRVLRRSTQWLIEGQWP